MEDYNEDYNNIDETDIDNNVIALGNNGSFSAR